MITSSSMNKLLRGKDMYKQKVKYYNIMQCKKNKVILNVWRS